MIKYYNIPRKIRELQLTSLSSAYTSDYNIPRKIRELQSMSNGRKVKIKL